MIDAEKHWMNKMSQSKQIMSLALFVVALFHSPNASANCLDGAGEGPYAGYRATVDKVMNRVYSNWVPSISTGSRVCALSGKIVREGKIYDVTIKESSGDAQFDADCLQALLGAFPSEPIAAVDDGKLWSQDFSFSSQTKSVHKRSGIADYFNAHPNEKQKFIAFYRIPIDVLNRYPGLFTEDELQNDDNVGLIQSIPESVTKVNKIQPALSGTGLRELEVVYQSEWPRFYLEHPSPTKQQILDFRAKLGSDVRHPLN